MNAILTILGLKLTLISLNLTIRIDDTLRQVPTFVQLCYIRLSTTI
jgi:hypothetical protein